MAWNRPAGGRRLGVVHAGTVAGASTLAIVTALAVSLPLLDLVPCVTAWAHGVAACLR